MTINSIIVQRPDSTYPVILNPYKIDMSQFTEKVIRKAKFKISNVSDQKLSLTLISLPSGFLKVKLPKSIDAGATAEAEVELLDDKLDATFYKSITFEFDDDKKSRFTIPVKRVVKDMTKAPPPSGK